MVADFLADLNGLAEIQHYCLVFEDYELVLFDEPPIKLKDYTEPPRKAWYIKPKGTAKRMDEIIFSKPELLFSLINLGREIEEKDPLQDELTLSEEIIEWCKKFGLPYREEYFEGNYHDEEPVKVKNAVTGYTGFRLWEFKRKVRVLYGLFNLWYGLTYNDLEKVISYSPLVSKFDSQKDLKKQILQMKDHLARRVWHEMEISHVSFAFQYDQQSDKYVVTPSTDNLLGAAYFQFALLMVSGGSGIKFCSKCGKLFEAEHGNKKICSKCDDVYHRDYMRERRRKDKS